MKSEIQDILTKVAEKKLTGEEAHRLIEQLNPNGNADRPGNDAGETVPRGKFTRRYVYDEPLLRDHTVFGEQVLLGVTHCSLAVEAARWQYPDREIHHLHKLLFVEPVILNPGEEVEVEVSFEEKPGRIYFKNRFKKSNRQEYREAATGEILPGTRPTPPSPIDIDGNRNRAEKKLPGEQVYKELGAIVHGPTLRTVQQVFTRGQEVAAELSLSREIIDSTGPYTLHPALLDGAIVSSTAALAGEINGPFVPVMVKEIDIFAALPSHCYSQTRIVKHNTEVLIADIRVCDGEGAVLLSMEGFTCKRVSTREVFGVEGGKSDPAPTPRPTPVNTRETREASGGGGTHRIDAAIEEYIAGKLDARIGGKKRVLDKKKNFMDLGIDSGSLMSLSQEIERDLAIELYPTLFFEYQNIAELSRYFAQEFARQFTGFFNAGGPGEKGAAGTSAPPVNASGLKEEKDRRDELRGEIAGNDNGVEPKGTAVGTKGTREDEKPVEAGGKPGGISAGEKEIAVIGMAGVFAGSPDVEAFWRNLRDQKNLMKEIPPDHFDYRPWYEPEPAPGKTYCKWGSFIEDVDKFDAAFFGISPREAEVMDPQLRHLLQVLYAAAEDAGYASRFRGTRTGMYVGVCFYDYMQEMGRLGVLSPYTGTGNVTTMMSNRPSFCFDIKGPSLSVDTACSSSLVALHLACKSLQRGECEMAFTAGTNLLLSSNHYVYFSSIRALSFSGRCHTFDKRADGYTPGEAVGAVLLKPLTKALADQDRIYAVIKGTAVNHGGYTSTITAPNPAMEAQVIREAWQDAGLEPETLGYIEAHGTGTKLGDPIEIDGLRKAFKKYTEKEKFCAIGSVKAHIGHAEGAAGIAGLIKVILSMKKGRKPAMPNFRELNPLIKLEGTPLYINREVEKWDRMKGSPRRAGISSFGFGGAYAHVVVEEYEPPAPGTREQDRPPYIFVLSARDQARLKAYAGVMRDYLRETAAPGPGPAAPGSEEDEVPGIRENLRAQAAKILGIEAKNIGTEEDLREYGFDVTTLAEYAEGINETYKMGITASIYPAHPTIEAQAQYIAARQRAGAHREAPPAPGTTAPGETADLAKITYTLQLGREAMAERLAITAADKEELENRLTRYIQGEGETGGIEGLYRGSAGTARTGDEHPGEGKDREEIIRAAVKDREYSKLAELWVNGEPIDWNLLYKQGKPGMISLPTYPFEKKSYWYDSYQKKAAGADPAANRAEPAVNKNRTPPAAPGNDREQEEKKEKPAAKPVHGWTIDPETYKGDEVELKILEKQIALVIMQDKKNKNVFTEEVGIGLVAKFSEIRRDPDIKVVIITGYDNVFCMGGTKDILDNISGQKNTCADMSFVYRGLLECEVPVIGAIQGHAVGGGLIFGLFSDIVVMAEEGIYSSNFMKYGFTPGVGATFILKEKLGNTLATELMFTADTYTGEELKQRGAPFIFKKGNQVLNEALRIARQLMEKPLHSLKVLKTELAGRILEQLPGVIEREIAMHRQTVTHPEVKQNIEYYFGKTAGSGQKAEVEPIAGEAVAAGKVVLKSKTAGAEGAAAGTQPVETRPGEQTAPAIIPKAPGNTTTPGNEILPPGTDHAWEDEEPVKNKVIHIISNILHIAGEEIKTEAALNELGVDSIGGVEIMRDINRAFQLALDAVVLYDNPTITKLTRYIHREVTKNRPVREAVKFSGEAVPGKAGEEQDRREEYEIEGIKKEITGIICRILHFPEDEINTEASLNDLGVDSIGGVEIVRDINKTFQLNLDAVVLYDYSTITRLAGKVHQEVDKNHPGRPGAAKPARQPKPPVTLAEGTLKEEKPIKPGQMGEPAPAPGKVELKAAGAVGAAYIQGQPGKMVLKSKQEVPRYSEEIPQDWAPPRYREEKGEPGHENREDPAKEEKREKGEEGQPAFEEIAIIGMSCRYPGSRDIDEFWRNLSEGVDSVGEVPRERWDIDRYYDPNPRALNKTYCRWGGFLEDADKFDPLFFNISPLEAEIMDPQQRVFLEEAWRALESTGNPPESYSGKKCGVFVGVSHGDYMPKYPGSNLNTQLFMGASISILSARISYFLDLTGPNLAIDTACSSSLVAIHQACQSIANGESEVALAGGVCVLAGPDLHIMTSKGDMLSRTGKCKTFDNSADGFVPAEGVGIVVLKSLEKAKQDKDTIWGVIKGTALNQDGKTNGITAPSANSQYKLETEVYRKYKIDPAGIGYVETHGTGTKLGDPIEIAALTRSFQEFTDKKQYCPIGSVKTNIGHTLTAAGAASLIKVLLCFKHKKLVPSLHFKEENEHIRFRETPFYVNTELKEWKTGSGVPRRAAVSSFGFSGTNCHMVVEESPAPPRGRTGTPDPYYLIPLSAKSGESLAQRTRDLGAWLEKNGTAYELGEIAYTLITGRTHFTHRTALVVKELHQLKENLKILEQGGTAPGSCTNEGEENPAKKEPVLKTLGNEILKELGELGEPGGQKTITASEHREKLSTLADLYVKGYDLDWKNLYRDREETYRRILLPHYPFDRGRYWYTPGEAEKAWVSEPVRASRDAGLHPLLDVNESTLEEEKYKKTITPGDFYIKDHVVGGDKLLPGVAYLEMARAAGQLAGGRPVKAIKDVIWAQPVVLHDSPKEIHIGIYPGKDRELFYEVYGMEAAERQVYTHGKMLQTGETPSGQTPAPQRFDLESIKKRCPEKIRGEDIYRHYEKFGFRYGPSFQVTRELYCGEREALARIELPRDLAGDYAAYGLHPSLMDGALRIIMKIGTTRTPEEIPRQLPFALGSLEIFASLPAEFYSYAVLTPGQETPGTGTRKYNISILDETGTERLRVTDFSSRQVKQGTKPRETSAREEYREILYYQPAWEETPYPGENDETLEAKEIEILETVESIVVFDGSGNIGKEVETIIGTLKHPVTLVQVKPGRAYKALKGNRYEVDPGEYGDYERLFKALQEQGIHPGHLVHVWNLGEPGENRAGTPAAITDPGELAAQLDTGIYSMMNIVKAVTALKSERKTRCIFGIPGAGGQENPQFEAISGFANALTTVNHRFELIGVRLDPQKTGKHRQTRYIIHELIAGDNVNGTQIRYRENRREVRQIRHLEETARERTGQEIPLKPRGVYIITGGAGGLGMIFAGDLAENYRARLVLVGRTQENETIRQKEEEIRRRGGEAIYVQADVSNLEEVRGVVKACKERYRGLDGIIHAAGIGRAQPVTQIDKAGFERVLLPKIHGTVNLDIATREEKLDFFVMFSSLAALLGDFGVCSYAAGNSYMDSYAQQREENRRNGQRSGKTLSINWPYWEQGEMALPPGEAAIYFKYSGMKPLETRAGLEAFKAVLAWDLPQVIIAGGERNKITRVLRKEISRTGGGAEGIGAEISPAASADLPPRQQGQEAKEETAAGTGQEAELTLRTGRYLKELLAKAIKLPVEKIDTRVPLENYGISSVMIMDLNGLLEKDFEALPKTLFFEYGNLREMTGYFVANQAQQLKRLFKLEGREKTPEEPGEPGAAVEEIRREDRVEPAMAAPDRRRYRRYPERQEPGPRASQKAEEAGVEIAIIGISGRYPKARDLEEFWANLEAGKDGIVEIPPERWDYRHYYDPVPKTPGKMYSKWGGFIEEADRFDPLFFKISPREAEAMDPQERIFMETAWSAIEDAGYTREQLAESAKRLNGSSVGVFAGVMWGNYRLFGGNSDYSAISNRVSYWLNAHGPSMTIDTACSSSLMALHHACESLRKGECRYAVAGGVNLSLHPLKYINLSQANILSTDGRCRSFGAGGDGYVPGEGVGAVLLKPLEAARAEGDHIYAVLKGSATNHGGKTNGYTVPNPHAQAEVIHQALQNARVNPRTVSYIEAHGTGTILGDPIEITGLTKTYEKYTQDKQYCAIGSVKSNVGHLEGAAGIVALTKVVLQMKHRRLVPSIHARPLNPNIDFAATPFYVQQESGEWARPVIKEEGGEREYPRRAGISSFGAGGTNVHLILEEYTGAPEPRPEKTAETGKPELILLSARNPERLKAYAGRMAGFLNPPGIENIEAPGKDNPGIETIEKEIARLAAEIMAVKPGDLEVNTPWSDYGIHRVSLDELARRIGERYEIKLDQGLFIEESTIAGLARYIGREYGKSRENGKTNGRTDPDPGNQNPGTSVLLPVSLEEMAYTLQVGREPQAERLAVIAANLAELKEKLAAYTRENSGTGEIENLYTGNIKNDRTKAGNLVEGEEGEVFVKSLLAKRRLDKLAQLWIDGVDIDWRLLDREKIPTRISLPVYPFAKQSYWLPQGEYVIDITRKIRDREERAAVLHPLVHTNTSTMQVQRYTTWFTGKEFYLADHEVAGRKVMPGVVYLEMARAAGEIAAESPIKAIKNVVWLKPVTAEHGTFPLHINLIPHNREIEFQVTGQGGEDRPVVYVRGIIEPGNPTRDNPAGETPGPNRIDIEAVKKRCPEKKSGDECYRVLAAAGLNYGPTFQTLREIYSGRTETLARIRLTTQREKENELLLHPALMDGAFTSIVGLMARENRGEGRTYLPFELGELEILKPLTGTCYVVTTYTGPRGEPGEGPQKVDIKITDETGEILVEIKKLSVRPMKITPPATRDEVMESETMYFCEKWEESGVKPTAEPLDSIVIFDIDSRRFEILKNRLSPGKNNQDDETCILVTPGKGYRHPGRGVFEINPGNPGDYGQLVEVLRQQKIKSLGIAHLWSWASPAQDSPGRCLDMGLYSLFYLTRELVKRKFPGVVRLLYLYESGAEEDLSPVSRALHGAVGGFANSIRQEHPAVEFKTIGIGKPAPGDPGLIELLEKEIRGEAGTGHETEIRYEAGHRYKKHWEEFDPAGEKQAPGAGGAGVIKEKGVYIITGGTGGLGMILAENLAREYKARLVLVGRSEITPGKQQKISALETQGAEVLYIRADISDPEAVKRLVQETRSRFHGINGVLHCAGQVRDSLVEKKTREEMAEVLAPKVYGTLNLDEATKDDRLEFFVMFSSTAVLGNRGQSDYAYANSFMDRYAERRESLCRQGQRSGKTLSINWPYWKEGGMKVDEQTEKLLKTIWGMRPLTTQTGLQVFYQGITREKGHFMVIEGQRRKVRKAMNPGEETKPGMAKSPALAASEKPGPAAEEPGLGKKIQQEIVKMISGILKIKEDQIGLNDDLKEFGFDSISLTELANRVNETYNLELTPTVFFELDPPTPGALARYLNRQYNDRMRRHYTREKPAAAPDPGAAAIETGEKEPKSGPGEELKTRPGEEVAPGENKDEIQVPRSRFREPVGWTREPAGQEIPSRESAPGTIAIIGMSGVMPQSKNLEIFWKHLEEGRDLIGEIPGDRWDWRAIAGETGGSPAAKWGGFIEDVDKFDALFFGISRREAEIMDPQQRLFMAAVWKTIEDAGYRASDLSGSKTGLFVGVATMDYADMVKARYREMDAHMATGMTHSVLANRISYFMNWHGPSEPVDTACSSSLVALHRAAAAIRAGDCDQAVVGGVNIMLTPSLFSAFAKAGMLSEDGRCKTFDKRANGYVRGEGVAAVFLKPLGKAEADGDHIYAVIKGTAVNHGGHATSLTAPNSNAQAELLITAYERAQVDPAAVTYIEAHGTGTTLGDPIEIDGLKKAFTELYRRRGKTFPAAPHCGLGSVKTNIGHLETAAGIAGVVKVLLAMKNKKLPQNVHFREINPYIDLRNTPFFIVEKTQPWECQKDENNREIPRIAGVSSFGFGGVNSHVVMEEYRPREEERPGAQDTSPSAGAAVVVLSARDKDRLREYAGELARILEQNREGVSLAEIAYTMQVGREEYQERLALVVADKEELPGVLKGYCRGNPDRQRVYEGNSEGDEKITGLLMDEAESSEWVKTIIAKRKMDKIARLWVTGVKIDWRLLYNRPYPRRISLPTYPFAAERYWIPGTEGPGTGIRVPGVEPTYREPRRETAPEAKPRPAGSFPLQTPGQTQEQPEPGGIIPQIKQAGCGRRQDLLVTYLKSRISELLRMDLAKIGENKPLEHFGFDSILVLQLKNKINVELAIDVPIEKFVGNVNIQKISDLLLVRMALADLVMENEAEVETEEEMEEWVI